MKKNIFSTPFRLLKITIKKWWSRDPFSQSETVAYNAIFSLPGLLVVIIAIAGYFFGADAVSGKLFSEISQTMGPDTADQIQNMVLFASKSKDSMWATLLGVGIMIFGATRVFIQFQKSLNRIWEVEESKTKSGIWSFLKKRIFSFGLIVSIAFLLLISLVVSSLLSAFSSWVVQNWSESLLIISKLVSIVFSLGIIAVLFALMFKFLPDAKIKWRTVWKGAFLTALLFTIGKFALALYFGKTDPGSGYGAAGSIILILLWTTYSSMIVFLGAEFTKVYSDYKNGRLEDDVKPKDKIVKKKLVP